MNRPLALATLIAFECVLGAQASRQSALLKLPDASPAASVAQRIGITDITIASHRPLVRGRKIFGGLVAYGQVWRAGANQNTTTEFTDPVSIEGQSLRKGIYGLHLVPGEGSWVVIFSKNSSSWGSFTVLGSQSQLHDFARGLQAPGHQTEAMQLFHANIQKDQNRDRSQRSYSRRSVER